MFEKLHTIPCSNYNGIKVKISELNLFETNKRDKKKEKYVILFFYCSFDTEKGFCRPFLLFFCGIFHIIFDQTSKIPNN